MFNFVPLTYRAGTNIILNDGAGMFHMEIPAKAMKIEYAGYPRDCHHELMQGFPRAREKKLVQTACSCK